MTSDGGLRGIFRNRFNHWQWSSIETAGSATGVPDSEFCTPAGCQGWVEYKQTHIYAVKIRSLQVAWLDQRCRFGGNAWIAVRRVPLAQKSIGADELWLMKGDQASPLYYGGLECTSAMIWHGGPSNWNYDEIAKYLTQEFSL